MFFHLTENQRKMRSILDEIESIACLHSSLTSSSTSESTIADLQYIFSNSIPNSIPSSSNTSCLSLDDLLFLSSNDLCTSKTPKSQFKSDKCAKKSPEQLIEERRSRNRLSAKKSRERRLAEIKYWKNQAHAFSVETALLKERLAEMEKEKKKWILLSSGI